MPVELVDNSSTTVPSTDLALPDNYGCSINGRFYAEGAQVPSNSNKPCELCYCIRNMTACVMQECTLHIDGCQPIYNKGVCCPVRYSCGKLFNATTQITVLINFFEDHESDVKLLDDHSTTTVRPTEGFILTTPKTDTQECIYSNITYSDGSLIKTEDPCKHCYCMKGDIVCAVPECGEPLEHEDCVAVPPKTSQCCPDTYICNGSETVTIPPELEDHQQHIVPQKTPVKGGVDTKRKGPLPEKPKDTKVDKSSEEDLEEDQNITTATHSTRTESTVLGTEKAPLDIPTTTIQSGDNFDEEHTDIPIATDVETTQKSFIGKPDNVDDRFAEDETTFKTVTEHVEIDEPATATFESDKASDQDVHKPEIQTIETEEQTTIKDAQPVTVEPERLEVDEEESSGFEPTVSTQTETDQPLRTDEPSATETITSTITYSEEQGMSKGDGVSGSAESGESTEDKIPTTEGPIREDTESPQINAVATEITPSEPVTDHKTNNETASVNLLDADNEDVSVGASTIAPAVAAEEKTDSSYEETPAEKTEIDNSETTIATEHHNDMTEPATLVPHSGEDAAETTPVIPSRSAGAEEDNLTSEDELTTKSTNSMPDEVSGVTTISGIDKSEDNEPDSKKSTPDKIKPVTSQENESLTTTESIIKSTVEKESIEVTETTEESKEKEISKATETPSQTTASYEESTETEKPAAEISSESSTKTPELDYAELPVKDIVTELPAEEDVPEPVTLSQKPMESDSHKFDDTTTRPDLEVSTDLVVPSDESDEMNTVIPEKTTDQPGKSQVPETTLQPDHKSDSDDNASDLPSQVPGEGDCLFNGITYFNNAPIPTDEECLESCVCFNSIVRCKSTCDLDSGATESPTVDEEDTTAVVVEVTKPSVEIPAIVKEIYPTETPIPGDEKTEENEIDSSLETTSRPFVQATTSPDIDLEDSVAHTTEHQHNENELTTVPNVITEKIETGEIETTEVIKDFATDVPETESKEEEAHATKKPNESVSENEKSVEHVTKESEDHNTEALEEHVTEEPDEHSTNKSEEHVTDTIKEHISEESQEPVTENADATITEKSVEYVADKSENDTTEKPVELGNEKSEMPVTKKTEEHSTDKSKDSSAAELEDRVIEQSVKHDHDVESTTSSVEELDEETTSIKSEIVDQTTELIIESEPQDTEKPAISDENKVDQDEDEPLTQETTVAQEKIENLTEGTPVLTGEQAIQTTESPGVKELSTEIHLEETSTHKIATIPKDDVSETTAVDQTSAADVPTEPSLEKSETTYAPHVEETTNRKPGNLDDRISSGEEQEVSEITTMQTYASTEDSLIQETFVPMLEKETTIKPLVDEPSIIGDIDYDITTIISEKDVVLDQKLGTVAPKIDKEIDSTTDSADVTTTSGKTNTDEDNEEPKTTLSPKLSEEPVTTRTHLRPDDEDSEKKPSTESLGTVEEITEHITESNEQETEKSIHDETTVLMAQGSAENVESTSAKASFPIETTEKQDENGTEKTLTDELEHKTIASSQQEKNTTPESELVEAILTEKVEKEPSSTERGNVTLPSSSTESDISSETDSDIKHLGTQSSTDSEIEKEESTTKADESDETTNPSPIENYTVKTMEEDVTSKGVDSSIEIEMSTQKDVLMPEENIESETDAAIKKTTVSSHFSPSTEAVKDIVEEYQTVEPDTHSMGTTEFIVDEDKATRTDRPEHHTTSLVETSEDPRTETQPDIQTTVPARSQFDSSEDHDTTTESKIKDADVSEPHQTEKSVEDSVIKTEEITSTPAAEEFTIKPEMDETEIGTVQPHDSVDKKIESVETTSKSINEEDTTQTVTDATTNQSIEADVQATKKPTIEDIQKPIHHDHAIPEHPLEEPYTTNAPIKSPDSGLPQAGYPNYDEDYTEEDEDPTQFGPGTCRYGGKLYVSAQQIPRDDPCDFCFCFRSDIICLQQSCPPPIQNCHEEPISGFCCPRYECHVGMATVMNITTSTTTTTTTLPPHFVNSYKGAARKGGCLIQGKAYSAGEEVRDSSTPCMKCE